MNFKKMLRELKAASIADNAVDFGVLVIILVVVANIVQTMQGTQNSGTASYNVSVQGLQGVLQFSNWLVIIAIVIVAGYLIFMVRGGAIQGAGYGGSL